MKKIIIFVGIVLLSIPLLFAQNTKEGVNETQFIGKYTFVDVKGNTYDIEIKKSQHQYKADFYDEKDVRHEGLDYEGIGTCTVNGKIYYFHWVKYLRYNYLEMEFSLADFPDVEINGNAYKSRIQISNTIGYYIKNDYWYYDGTLMLAESPNLRFKLTKKQ